MERGKERIPNKKQKRHWKNVHPNASMNLMEKLLPVRPRRKREKRKGIGEKKLSHRRWCMQQRQTWSTVIEAAGKSRKQKKRDRTHKLTKFNRKPICLPISFAGYNCCCTHKHTERKKKKEKPQWLRHYHHQQTTMLTEQWNCTNT